MTRHGLLGAAAGDGGSGESGERTGVRAVMPGIVPGEPREETAGGPGRGSGMCPVRTGSGAGKPEPRAGAETEGGRYLNFSSHA